MAIQKMHGITHKKIKEIKKEKRKKNKSQISPKSERNASWVQNEKSLLQGFI
uniref:Uncharacterized protein n=1 Tax=Rhizophora mucronata TaxID=61149 RepID=A0A2P2PVP1_RHIMU